jgi:hypothetical protein
MNAAKTTLIAVLSLLVGAAASAAAPNTSAGGDPPDSAALLSDLYQIAGPAPEPEHSQYLGTVIFTCVNANASGTGPHILDRDNTGTGQEALRVDVTDGTGTLIYTLTFQNVLGSFAGGIGNFFYTTPPQTNPLRFRLTSLAGNGLPEQIDYFAEGECVGLPSWQGIPTLSAAGLGALVALLLAAAIVMLRRHPHVG